MSYVGGPMFVPPSGHSGVAAASQKDVMQIVQIALRCWWKIAVPIGLVLAVSAMAATIKLVKPRYTASAWIEIRERPEAMLLSASGEDARKYVQNQVELIRSPLIVDGVAANP